MPHGIDNVCFNCIYNESVRQIGTFKVIAHSIKDNKTRMELIKFQHENAFCNLRKSYIDTPSRTTCINFIQVERTYNFYLSYENKYKEYDFNGSVGDFYQFLSDIQPLPWQDNQKPKLAEGICHICGVYKPGVSIHNNGNELYFCSREHYIQWWSDTNSRDVINFDLTEESSQEIKHQREVEKAILNGFRLN